MMDKKDVTILVSTCDNFFDLWINNKNLFERFWPNHPDILYFSDANTHVPNFDVMIFEKKEFSLRLKEALNKVKTDYVFLTLDDYLIDRNVNIDALNYCFDYLKNNNGDYFRFFKRTKVKGNFLVKKHKIKRLPFTKKAYEVNLYPSLWKKSSLLNLIKNEENIWKFEVRLTRRSRQNNYIAYASYDSNIFHFVDTIRKGKYIRKAYRFLKKQNLFISDRKKRSVSETILLGVQTFLSRHMPKKIKASLKKRSGRIYYSDYAETDD